MLSSGDETENWRQAADEVRNGISPQEDRRRSKSAPGEAGGGANRGRRRPREPIASYAAVFRHTAPPAHYQFELAACWESRYVEVVLRVSRHHFHRRRRSCQSNKTLHSCGAGSKKFGMR